MVAEVVGAKGKIEARKKWERTNGKEEKRNSAKEVRINTFLNTLIEGNCLDVMKDIPSKSIDMILCDLPYGTTQNKWDSVIPLDLLWKEYRRIIKDRGVIALTAQGVFTAMLTMSNPTMYKYKFVWIKSKPTNFLNAKNNRLGNMKIYVFSINNNPHIILR
ncbi:MAG: hypothetical protein Q7J27_08605 [Syntrophales bacterium]|nr:hypothetical protein [Syntrophales bacterium]